MTRPSPSIEAGLGNPRVPASCSSAGFEVHLVDCGRASALLGRRRTESSKHAPARGSGRTNLRASGRRVGVEDSIIGGLRREFDRGADGQPSDAPADVLWRTPSVPNGPQMHRGHHTAPSERPAKRPALRAFRDGASRARTGDLLGAIQALSQLSYSPAEGQSSAALLPETTQATGAESSATHGFRVGQ